MTLLDKYTFYCVACGVIETEANGLDRCANSDLGLSHLWAVVGHVQDWFPVKRVRAADGTIVDPEVVASAAV